MLNGGSWARRYALVSGDVQSALADGAPTVSHCLDSLMATKNSKGDYH